MNEQWFGIGANRKPPPRECLCNEALPKPTYTISRMSQREKRWHMICPRCGLYYVWSHPGVWKVCTPDPMLYIAGRLRDLVLNKE